MQDNPPPQALVPIDRNSFEEQFPVMFQFYKERGRLNEEQLLKVQEIQSRWKAGLVFWLTSDNKVIEIPDWVAMNVVINNKTNIFRSSRICMSLNHTKGYGCNRLAEGTCSYIHECVLCGQNDHGVFQKRPNGSLICKRLRKWNEEEERFKNKHGDTHSMEDRLSDLANRARDRPPSQGASPTNHSQGSGANHPLHQSRPLDQAQKVKTLSGTTGCSEQEAFDLLVASRWNIQLAADAYFELDGSSSDATPHGGPLSCAPSGAVTPSGSTGPGCWGPGRPQGGGTNQQEAHQTYPKDGLPPLLTSDLIHGCATAQSKPGTAVHAEVRTELPPGALDLGPPWEDTTPSPPPAQPPPPRMPPNWQALWSEQHQAYYFWHMPTSKTTWEAPSLEGAVSPTASTDTAPGSSTATIPSFGASEAGNQFHHRVDQGLPGLNGIGSLCGSLGQLQLGHTPNDPSRASSNREHRAPFSTNLHERTLTEREAPGRVADQHRPVAGELLRERTDAERKAEELWSSKDGHYLCTQHWWPPPGGDTCMRLFHGEHVTVTWTDGKDGGWAYGHTLDDQTHEGYFPQAILKEVKRFPRRRIAGEACSVAERFEAPAGVTGYLTVAPGDVLKILHTLEAPSVWAYVEGRTIQGLESGWVPESVLNDALGS